MGAAPRRRAPPICADGSPRAPRGWPPAGSLDTSPAGCAVLDHIEHPARERRRTRTPSPNSGDHASRCSASRTQTSPRIVPSCLGARLPPFRRRLEHRLVVSVSRPTGPTRSMLSRPAGSAGCRARCLINPNRHGLDRLGHHRPGPATDARRVRRPHIRRTVPRWPLLSAGRSGEYQVLRRARATRCSGSDPSASRATQPPREMTVSMSSSTASSHTSGSCGSSAEVRESPSGLTRAG